MARSVCKKCGAAISNDFSHYGTWCFLDTQSRAWKCYEGEEHEPSTGQTTSIPSPLPFERMVNEGDAELYIKYGVHEPGIRIGTQYVAYHVDRQIVQMLQLLKTEATEVVLDGPRPECIIYKGKKYYESRYAKANKLPAYGEFELPRFDEPSVPSKLYLAPKVIVDAVMDTIGVSFG